MTPPRPDRASLPAAGLVPPISAAELVQLNMRPATAASTSAAVVLNTWLARALPRPGLVLSCLEEALGQMHPAPGGVQPFVHVQGPGAHGILHAFLLGDQSAVLGRTDPDGRFCALPEVFHLAGTRTPGVLRIHAPKAKGGQATFSIRERADAPRENGAARHACPQDPALPARAARAVAALRADMARLEPFLDVPPWIAPGCQGPPPRTPLTPEGAAALSLPPGAIGTCAVLPRFAPQAWFTPDESVAMTTWLEDLTAWTYTSCARAAPGQTLLAATAVATSCLPGLAEGRTYGDILRVTLHTTQGARTWFPSSITDMPGLPIPPDRMVHQAPELSRGARRPSLNPRAWMVRVDAPDLAAVSGHRWLRLQEMFGDLDLSVLIHPDPDP